MSPWMRAGEAHLHDDQANRRLADLLHPGDWANPTPSGPYDLLVLGGGTAGLVSAAVGSGLGARVALVERSLLGGDCLNFGCVPSKALLASAAAAQSLRHAAAWGLGLGDAGESDGPLSVDGEAVWRRVRSIRALIADHDSARRFQGLGVDVFLGAGRFDGPDSLVVGEQRLQFRRAVIATGATPSRPPIPGLDEVEVLSNENVFELEGPPSRLAIVGGGAIGCELAQAFCRLGTRVTLIEMAPRLLPQEDGDAAAVLRSVLESEGVEVLVGATVTGVSAVGAAGDGVRLSWQRVDGGARDGRSEGARGAAGDGAAGELAADRLLLATGRRARVSGLGLKEAGVRRDERGELVLDDGLRSTNRRIYAAGDVALAARFTHAADASARLVVRNALFPGRGKASKLRIPHCTYTDPELAQVGWTGEQAEAQGVAVETFTVPFAQVDRARVELRPKQDADELGFARVHVARGGDRIVGATIVGAHAGEMISEVTMAMDHKIGLGDLSSVIHPYPTRAEALRKLGDAYQRGRLTPLGARLLHRWLGLWRRLPMLALLLSMVVSGALLGCATRDDGQVGGEAGTPVDVAIGSPATEELAADVGRVGGGGAAEEASPPPTELPADATATARAAIVFGADRAPIGPPAAPGWEGQDWPDVLLEATGTTVRWAMWAGDPRINDWVDDYVADVAAGRLGIGLEVVPLNDTVDAVNRIATDKAADLEDGSIDLLWVNGENFHTLRQGDLLYGPWAQWTPASTYLDWQDPSWQLDLGVPVEGYEMPWGRAILVLIHDTARLSEPPDTLEALLAWIQDNPGRFTYPAPPDFTGSAFVRQVCAALTPRPELLLRPASEVSDADIAAALAPCWVALGDLAPSLWREGSTYPASLAQQNDLFANGEIDLDLNYNPAAASGFIADGRYPETTRTFVLRDGMLANTHYLAIPWNAPNKAGAMALADLLGQPAAQLAKAQPEAWGDLPVIDPERLSDAWRIALDELPLGPATLPLEELVSVSRPEPHASWVSVIEQGWVREVLER